MNRKYVGHVLLIALVFCFGVLVSQPALSQTGALIGAFTVTDVVDSINGGPSTEVFEHLLDLPLMMNVSFDNMSVLRVSSGDIYDLEVSLYPAHVTFEGDTTSYLQDVVAPTWKVLRSIWSRAR